MKRSQRFLCYRIRFILAGAIAVYVYITPPVWAQSLATCETVTVPATNGELLWQTNCIDEWYSGDTPQITASVEVSGNNDGYLTAVDAVVTLYDPSGPLAYQDANPDPYQPTFDEDAYVTVAMSPGDVYDVRGGYAYCYDSTGNGGYYPPPMNGWSCGGPTYGDAMQDLGTNIFFPAAQVLSVLYAVPGDKSTNGYTTGTTNGTTSSVGSSFTQSYGFAFSGQGEVFGNTGGGSIGYSHAATSGQTTSYQTTVTNQTGITELANTLSQYNPNKLDMPNRVWDSFAILLNPEATTASDDTGNIVGYSVDQQPVQGDGWTVYSAISEAVAEDMINGTVPTDTLNPTPLPLLPNQPQHYLPGLASICKNLNQSEYNSGTCGPSDQCGCQNSDYSPILGRDALLGWNSSTLTANPMPAYESPVDADTSGSACLTPNSSLSCRYVPIPQSSTNPSPQVVTLNYAFSNPISQNDSTSTTTTLNEQTSYNITLTLYYGWGISIWGTGGGVKLTNTDSWTWTDSESQGTISGTQNAMNVNLQTDNTGCAEDNYVYEDTLYHTFVVQPPQDVPNCKQ